MLCLNVIQNHSKVVLLRGGLSFPAPLSLTDFEAVFGPFPSLLKGEASMVHYLSLRLLAG